MFGRRPSLSQGVRPTMTWGSTGVSAKLRENPPLRREVWPSTGISGNVATSRLKRGNIPVRGWRRGPLRHAQARRVPDDSTGAECHVAGELALTSQARATAIRIRARLVRPAEDRHVGLRAW